MSPRGQRVTAVVVTAAALAVGQFLTREVSIESESRPFYRYGEQQVALSYADVAVGEATGARYLGGTGGDDLVKRASGVWVVVPVTITATREPVRVQQAWLVDADERTYYSSNRAPCPTFVLAATGVPTHTLYCFDVPADRVAGLHLRLARGDVTLGRTDGDDVADLDLGLTTAQERAWAGTEVALGIPDAPDLAPVEPQEITLQQTEGEDS